jgi:hypothetical protein
MESPANDEQKRPATHRSPAYPAITLQKAVERARSFYQHEKRNSANAAVALSHWNYSATSGNGRTTLAAMLAFGLMKDEGANEKRQVRLSDLAFRIILDDRPQSQERDAALKEAALMPKIYKELLAKFPRLEVSDANLKHFLLVEKKFNDNAVKDFIADLRATVSFAKLAVSPDNDDKPPGAGEVGPEPEVPPPAPPAPSVPPEAPPASSGAPAPLNKGVRMRQDVFTLSEGDVTIQWPEQLSQESFEDFADWLRILERKIKRSVQAPEPAKPPRRQIDLGDDRQGEEDL